MATLTVAAITNAPTNAEVDSREAVDRVFFTVNLVSSCIALVFAPVGAVCLWRRFRTTHFNLRFLTTLLALDWIMAPLANIMLAVMVLENGPERELTGVYFQITRNALSVFAYIIRYFTLAICVERSCATVFALDYEKATRYRVIAPVLAVIMVIVAVFLGLLYNLFRIEMWILIVNTLLTDLGSAVGIILLNYQNRKLRERCRSASLTLKYQLVENVNTLNLLRPLAITGFIACFLGVCIAIPLIYLNFNGAPINFILRDFYIVAFAIYLTPFRSLLEMCRGKVEPNRPGPVLTVANSLGHQMRLRWTTDEYFRSLQSSWT